MLGFLFGFNARLGRMHYFLSTVALAVAMTAVCFAIASYAFQKSPGATLTVADLMTWPTMSAIGVFMWATFTLQCMRVRDIGWDPVCVIPAWIAIVIVDKLVAVKIPAWALGPQHDGTVVGGLINMALILALTFWPSGDYERPTPTFGEPPRKPDQPSRRQNTVSVAQARIARASGQEFGGRVF